MAAIRVMLTCVRMQARSMRLIANSLKAVAISSLFVGMIGAVSPLLGQSQTPSAALPTFDVVSVKLSTSPLLSTRFERAGTHISWTTDLWYVIEYAYRVQNWQISGSIPASYAAAYNIDAVTNPKTTDDQLRIMFQSLLADRFKIKFHRVVKERPGYALSVATGGLKIQAANKASIPPLPFSAQQTKEDAARREHSIVSTAPRAGVVRVEGRRVTLERLCQELQILFREPVVNQTGLTAEYYFAFEYANDPSVSDVPTLDSALKDLGLSLHRERSVAFQTLVVDHIEKVPTPN